MLRVPVNKIQQGMILARPVPLPREPRRYLLQRDQQLAPDMIPRLKELGILEVWIRCRDLEFLEDVIDVGLGEHQREVYHHVRRNFEQIMSGAAGEVDFSRFQQSISGLFEFLKQSPTGSVLLQKLDAFDDYLLSHSTNVCYLSMLLGLQLERYLIQERTFKSPREAKDLQLLGLGCLLHDVGKMKVPQEILHKPGRLTDDEMRIMQMHTIFGYEMVKGRIAPAAAQVVLNHHQRWNGDGYPSRIDAATGEDIGPMRGRQIPVFSRIAAVVDVYDAATSQRCYSGAKLPVQVLHEMRTWCQGFFDPIVERAFYRIVPPFPIGQVVTLSDGVEAAVVDFNPKHPVRPKVQALRDPDGVRFHDPLAREFDLAVHRDLEIVSVDGIDVTPYLESQQASTLPTPALV